ncbi:amidohydrolase family protein [Amycolatopsis anabasis]|uniref:amidohydrolase family protein n=1 Tax=Amycolatopsis anabasis TaxID=1840409 RepID=UPI00131B66EC|nr:amidohydrolase family protein [Amycolatopsis anabasis]
MSQEDGDELARREVFRRGGRIAAGVGSLWLGAGLTGMASGAHAEDERIVEVHEGSNLCAAVSPDGRTVAMDALNAIWLVPLGGGVALRLTGDDQDATQPHWAPDGRSLVFQAFREGTYDLWTIGADGTGLRRWTDGPGYDLEPKFSPDGSRIAFSSDRDGESRIRLLDPATGEIRPLTDGDRKHAMPAWSPDGRKVVYVVGDTVIESVEPESGRREQLVVAPSGTTLYGPAFSPDGRTLSYVRVTGPRTELVAGDRVLTTGEDVYPFAASWLSTRELLYTADGRIRRRALDGGAAAVAFTAAVPITARRYRRRDPFDRSDRARPVRGIASPVLSPDGTTIAFRALNALWLLPIGGRPRAIVRDGYFCSDPDWAPDGRSLVYASDRAGTANLWRYDLGAGESTRLTDLPNAQLTPRWSPDGTRIAYQDESGATWVLELAGGAVTQVLPALYQPGRPTWSPDGNVLALAAVRPYSPRSSAGHNQILTVDLRSGELRYQPVAPERSIATRGDDGPVWTSDGRYLVFGMESLAWRVPVDAAGRVTGPPVQLTGEVTDSLSVGADSRTVLYLSNGVLRMVGIDGGAPRTIQVGLPWRPRRNPDRMLIRAGAVWDGRSDSLRRDVDVLLDGDRIEALVPRGTERASRVLDASGLTVLPGLIDTHNHWHLRGRQWGDRQGRLWLAYGVTTSRSPGDPAYQMVETREALAAGDRIGPRYLGTGETLDGTRAYYNFMRPTFTRAQLERELDRAAGLGYDLVKSYMRLPVAFEHRVVAWAHAHGIPVTSHYLYPAAHTGLDGMEHTGGGNRLGYSRTRSLSGRTAADSVALLAASGMWISTTTLFAAELFVDDRSLIEDERTRVLFPSWEYQRLLRKAEDAAKPGSELNRAWTKGDVDMLLRVHRAGGLVVLGTDAALDDIGISQHQNLRALVKYGFTPREALLTATGNAARALGLGDRLGAVAPGLLADLVLVAGDPLSDIRAAAAVRTVLVGGVPYAVPDLLAPFRAAAATGPANPVRPAAPSAAPNPEHPWHRPEWDYDACQA